MDWLSDAEWRRKVMEQADREYHPCWNGLHVCGQTPDEERPLTVANVVGLSPAKFYALRDQFALPKDEDFDLVVDLYQGGDCVEDFCIRRQSLAGLLEAARK